MPAARRILLIRLSALGDVLFTLPAVNSVRDHFPEARLSYLVSRACAPLLEGFAAVDETIVFDRDTFRHCRPKSWWRSTIGLAHRLRRANFDLVIDFHSFGETAVLGYATGAPERWGTIEGKKLRRLAYTNVFPLQHTQHPVDRNLDFLRYCGVSTAEVRNQFNLRQRWLEMARAKLATLGIDGQRPFIFVQPFTSDPQKDLPIKKLLQFARHWKEQDVQVLFGGGPADRERLLTALQGEFATSAGIELLLTAGLMQLAALVVGSDTGTTHLAVALGRRVVMLVNFLGPQTPIPYGRPEWTVMPPAGRPVPEIQTEQLIAAADAALAQPAGDGLPGPA